MATITTNCDAPTISGDWGATDDVRHVRLRTILVEHVDAGEKLTFVCDAGGSIEMILPLEAAGAMKAALRSHDQGAAIDQVQSMVRRDRAADRSNSGRFQPPINSPVPERGVDAGSPDHANLGLSRRPMRLDS